MLLPNESFEMINYKIFQSYVLMKKATQFFLSNINLKSSQTLHKWKYLNEMQFKKYFFIPICVQSISNFIKIALTIFHRHDWKISLAFYSVSLNTLGGVNGGQFARWSFLQYIFKMVIYEIIGGCFGFDWLE